MRDFNHTIGVLVKAFIEGTLAHGTCQACAVGNIVADAIDVKLTKNLGEFSGVVSWDREHPMWDVIVLPTLLPSSNEEQKLSLAQVQATGYTAVELRKIENAFESAACIGRTYSPRFDYDGFNGLMAVVDVLAEIHGIDLTTREEAKKLFVKA